MAHTAENTWQGPGYAPGWNGPGQNQSAGPQFGPRPYGFGGRSWSPFRIVAIVLGFVVWWPIGLGLLFYTLWSKSMGCRHEGHWQHKMERMQHKMDRFRSRMEGGFGGGYSSSGNRAFDEYRMETLKRLEDEQADFKGFLDRLRHAKDKAEFDQFMADRKARPAQPDQPQA